MIRNFLRTLAFALVLTSCGDGRLSPQGGTIVGAVAGNGLIGGGMSGIVTLNVACGYGLTCLADSVAVDSTVMVDGSGTLNSLPLWTPDGNSLGNSIISQDVGATTVSVSGALAVSGAVTDTGNRVFSVAGTGLTSSAATVNVGCGYGLTCAADSVAVDPTVIVDGSGTLNYVPLWTPDGNTLGNSILTQSGGEVTVNGPLNVQSFKGKTQTVTTTGVFTIPLASDTTIVELNASAAQPLPVGMTGGVSGRMVLLYNKGTQNALIYSEHASAASAQDRFHHDVAGWGTLVNGGEMALAVYDGTAQRWRISWLTQTYSPGQFTALGDLTTTGNLFANYRLSGGNWKVNRLGTPYTDISSASINNWNPHSGSPSGFPIYSYGDVDVTVASAGAPTITGFDATYAQQGDHLTITNRTAVNFTFPHQSGSSLAASRWFNWNAGSVVLPPNYTVSYVYVTGLGWLQVSGVPGSGSMVAGSGTLNTIAMWTPDGTHLGNSPLTDTGTQINSARQNFSINTGAATSPQLIFNQTGQATLLFYNPASSDDVRWWNNTYGDVMTLTKFGDLSLYGSSGNAQTSINLINNGAGGRTYQLISASTASALSPNKFVLYDPNSVGIVMAVDAGGNTVFPYNMAIGGQIEIGNASGSLIAYGDGGSVGLSSASWPLRLVTNSTARFQIETDGEAKHIHPLTASVKNSDYFGDSGTAYGINISGYTTGDATGFIGHNVYTEYNSAGSVENLIMKYRSTHGSFGLRGIGFSYASSVSSATGGIAFYAQNNATTAGSAVTPTPKMVIQNDGKVGIGTTLAGGGAGALLHVAGTTKFGSTTSDTMTLTGLITANSTSGSSGQVLAMSGGLPKWTTISGSGGLLGTGTAGRLSLWNTASTLGNTGLEQYHPGTAVPFDATMWVYTPTTLGEWSTLVAADGIVAPDEALYLMQESSGTLADSSGNSNTWTVGSGTGVTYQQTTPSGWTRKSVNISDGAAGNFVRTMTNATTSSVLAIYYISVTATPAANRTMLELPNMWIEMPTTMKPQIRTFPAGSVDGSTATAWTAGSWHIIAVQQNVTTGVERLYIDGTETIVATTYKNTNASGPFSYGRNSATTFTASAPMALNYAAVWRGTGAEMTTTQVNALITKLWANPYDQGVIRAHGGTISIYNDRDLFTGLGASETRTATTSLTWANGGFVSTATVYSCGGSVIGCPSTGFVLGKSTGTVSLSMDYTSLMTIRADGGLTITGAPTISGATVMNSSLTVNSSATVTGALNGWTQVTKSADQDVTTTTLTDSTGMSLTVTANKVYSLDVYIAYGGTSNASDYKSGWTLTGGGTMDCLGTQTGTSTADAATLARILASTVASTTAISNGVLGTAADLPGSLHETFSCKIGGTGGTLKRQFALSTSTGTVREMAGSYIKWKQLN